MSYEAGTALSREDLLDKLRIFLDGLGWTTNKWEDDTSTHRGTPAAAGKRLHMSKGDLYFNFRSIENGCPFSYYYNGSDYSMMTGIAVYGSTGYDGAYAWDEQPGNVKNTTDNKTSGTTIQNISGSFTYWFFATSDFISVVVESSSGIYQHLVFGQIEKFGTYTGGYFCAGMFCHYRGLISVTPSDYIFLNWKEPGYDHTMHCYLSGVDSKTGWWANGDVAAQNRCGSPLYQKLATSCVIPINGFDAGENNCLNSDLFLNSPNSFNGVYPLLRIYVQAERTASNYSIIGTLPGVRQINMTNKSPGDEITIGSDVWVIFPWYKQIDTLSNVGMAYLK